MENDILPRPIDQCYTWSSIIWIIHTHISIPLLWMRFVYWSNRKIAIEAMFILKMELFCFCYLPVPPPSNYHFHRPWNWIQIALEILHTHTQIAVWTIFYTHKINSTQRMHGEWKRCCAKYLFIIANIYMYGIYTHLVLWCLCSACFSWTLYFVIRARRLVLWICVCVCLHRESQSHGAFDYCCYLSFSFFFL